jgi:hypothetical protein
MHLLTLRSFDEGLWQSTTNSRNFEGKPKCKHFDSPSGATEGLHRLLFLMCWHSTRQIHWSSAPLILLILFECGLRSLESFSSSGQQRLRIIRVRASVPRIVFFGPAAPPNSSSVGFGPSNRLLRANNASELFECGLCSLESFSSGQQRLYIIRVRALVPRIIFFGPAAPLYYSSAGFGPSNHSLRASNASILFECGLWSLELFSSDQQRLYVIRLRASVSRIILFGPAAPLRYSTAGFGPSNYSLRASSVSTLFECGFQSLESHLSAISAFILFGYGPLSFESLFYAINAFELPEIWWQYTNSDAVCQIRR